MNIFVSYARVDNTRESLEETSLLLSDYGRIYIDDLHYNRKETRLTSVITALFGAEMFVAVLTPHYLSTPWTIFEATTAHRMNIPIRILLQDGNLRIVTFNDLQIAATST